MNRMNYLIELGGGRRASGRDQSGTIMAIMRGRRPIRNSISLSLSVFLFLSQYAPFDAIVSRVRVTKGDLESLIALLVHSITLIHSRDPYTSLVPRYSD